MLVLNRKVGEKVFLDYFGVRVEVLVMESGPG